MQSSYYIDRCERLIPLVTNFQTKHELWTEYNQAFTDKSDRGFTRKLRIVTEKVNQALDKQSESA